MVFEFAALLLKALFLVLELAYQGFQVIVALLYPAFEKLILLLRVL